MQMQSVLKRTIGRVSALGLGALLLFGQSSAQTFVRHTLGAGTVSSFGVAKSQDDPRLRRIWVRYGQPALTGEMVGCAQVRDLSILKDTTNRAVLENGKYVAYFWGRQLPSGYIDTYRAESYDLYKFFNFSQVVSHGSAGLDVSYAGVGSVMKFGPTDYRLWYQAKTPNAPTKIALATSKDGKTWTKKGVVLSGDNLVDVYDLSVPNVTRLSTGQYVMLAEGNGLNETVKCWRVYGFVSPDGLKWTALNAGKPLLDLGPAGSWEAGFVANPKMMETAQGLTIEYNGGAVPRSDAAAFQIGFATAKSINGPWVKDPSNPSMGRTVSPTNYGLETSEWTQDIDGAWMHWVQDYPGGSRTSSIYEAYPMDMAGIALTSSRDSAAVLSTPVASGKFVATSNSFVTEARDDVTTPMSLLSLYDATNVVGGTAHDLYDQRRLMVRRCSGSYSTPGAVTISYLDSNFVEWFWTGSQWANVASTIPTRLELPVEAKLEDLGDNYRVTIAYRWWNITVTQVTIAKSKIKPFTRGRTLFIGDPCTEDTGGQLFVVEASCVPVTGGR